MESGLQSSGKAGLAKTDSAHFCYEVVSLLKSIVLLPLALFAAILVAGCSTRGGPVPYNVSNFAAPDNDRPIVGNQGVIGKLDVVSVAVYELPELNRDIQVDTKGSISIPLVGSLQAEGLTTEELSQQITSRLAARYVRSPSVQVGIKEAVGKQVTVEGSVVRPGVFQLRGETDLLSAIALASGPNEFANKRRVVVFRQIRGERVAAAFDLSSVRTGQSPNPAIYGNDIIVVDGSKLTRAYRDILQAVPLLLLVNKF